MDGEGVRETTITLRVGWDPATQDHPGMWEWEELLGCDAVVVDFSDKEDG